MTYFIGMTGASGSWKTYFAKKLVNRLPEISVKVGRDLRGVIIGTDDYYMDLSHLAPENRTKAINYDDPSTIDQELMFEQMELLTLTLL